MQINRKAAEVIASVLAGVILAPFAIIVAVYSALVFVVAWPVVAARTYLGRAALVVLLALSMFWVPPAAASPLPDVTPPACLTLAPDPALVPRAGPRRVDYVVLHHWGGTVASLAAAQAFFRTKGYVAPAYNAMFPESGGTWPGRSELMTSAATYGLNDRSIAGCLLGDLTKRPATDAQVAGAATWLKGARSRWPKAKFIQHCDASRILGWPSIATACPGERHVTARAIWLVVCGYSVPKARRLAATGK